mmetsp:Transcript_88238/g.180352  ORF Transcript_88238/g.180352 Transcript_88238/m.180352 type:complete len:165 (-) Transcript_88238:151-645(-)
MQLQGVVCLKLRRPLCEAIPQALLGGRAQALLTEGDFRASALMAAIFVLKVLELAVTVVGLSGTTGEAFASSKSASCCWSEFCTMWRSSEKLSTFAGTVHRTPSLLTPFESVHLRLHCECGPGQVGFNRRKQHGNSTARRNVMVILTSHLRGWQRCHSTWDAGS